MGEIREGETVEVTYSLRNEGDGTLVISDVRPRCETCMEVSMQQRRIPPGGTGKLEVKYEALDVVGEFTRYVVIESNNPSDRQVSVILQGEVLPEFGLEPRELDFGLVAGESRIKQLRVSGT